MNTILRVYLIALIWGIMVALVTLASTHGHHTLPSALAIVVDVLTAGFLFFAGRIGKRYRAKSASVGMLAGLIYGVGSGWPASIFTPRTRLELMNALKGHALPPGGIKAAVAAANAPLHKNFISLPLCTLGRICEKGNGILFGLHK